MMNLLKKEIIGNTNEKNKVFNESIQLIQYIQVFLPNKH